MPSEKWNGKHCRVTVFHSVSIQLQVFKVCTVIGSSGGSLQAKQSHEFFPATRGRHIYCASPFLGMTTKLFCSQQHQLRKFEVFPFSKTCSPANNKFPTKQHSYLHNTFLPISGFYRLQSVFSVLQSTIQDTTQGYYPIQWTRSISNKHFQINTLSYIHLLERSLPKKGVASNARSTALVNSPRVSASMRTWAVEDKYGHRQ